MNRLVFVHAGAVGDFVVTLPVLEALRDANPSARITILGRPHIAALALDGGLADSVFDVERAWVSTLFGPHPSAPKDVLRCDLCVTFLLDPTFARNLCACGAARVLEGTYQGPDDDEVHWADLAMSVLDPVGLARRPAVPRLRPSPASIAAIADVPERFVAVNPGTGGVRKRWPIDCWTSLLDAVDAPLVVLGGPGDEELVKEIRCTLGRALTSWIVDRPLPAVAGLLTRARAYVGCDSGITHLAAAVGCPTLALFGPTDPARFAPRGEQVTTLRNATAAAAIAWLQERLH
ncbi:MAG: glycosyltransferase family 9 protein [Planctomycetes bacterium]|nr:glycosyltransferase family 9 protein [Planctomycetota bacterium]MBI3844991.1 glycosyltransferase family 9 protein [Planctomycetota bacterium]